MTYRSAPRDIRASDSDRDRVLSLLSQAVADGRLTPEEHAERVEQADGARTLGDLVALTADLARPADQPIRLDGRRVVTGVFGRDYRDGRWVVPESLPVLAVFGEVVLDMRDALLTSGRVVVHAAMLGGTVRIIVPEGVLVETTGTAVLTRTVNRTGRRSGDPAGPVVEIRATGFGGSIRVSSPRRGRRLGAPRLGAPRLGALRRGRTLTRKA